MNKWLLTCAALALTILTSVPGQAQDLNAALAGFNETAQDLRAALVFLRDHAGSCSSLGYGMSLYMPKSIKELDANLVTINSLKGDEPNEAVIKLIAQMKATNDRIEQFVGTVRKGLSGATPQCQEALKAFEELRKDYLLLADRLQSISTTKVAGH